MLKFLGSTRAADEIDCRSMTTRTARAVPQATDERLSSGGQSHFRHVGAELASKTAPLITALTSNAVRLGLGSAPRWFRTHPTVLRLVKSRLAIPSRNDFDGPSFASKTSGAAMAGEAADDQGVSVLVEIARSAGTGLNPAQRLKLDALLAAGLAELVAPADALEPTRYAVTRQGQRLLDERGIGANES
jgi:hypothetical protein